MDARCILNPIPTRRTQRFRIMHKFAALLPLFLFTCLVPADEPPRIEEFPELMEACEPFRQYLHNDAGGSHAGMDESDLSQGPSIVAEGSEVLAFEENSRFICATVQSAADQPEQYLRRVLFIKPSFLIIDEIRDLSTPDSAGSHSSRAGIALTEGLDLQLAAGEEEKSVRLVLPADDGKARTISAAVLRESGVANPLRLNASYKSPFIAEAIVSLGNRVYKLTLPDPSRNASGGRIAIHNTDGNVILESRPLPAGVLPHGPEGLAMIERWDRAYRDGKRPSWDARQAAPELVRVIQEEAIVKPCRVVVLGCGSGDNAIYLAQQGFDVTAIDLAPTALGIAEQKAKQAGVEVDWMLADVLNIPDVEPFDFVFDRGCYHNVRYVDAEGFVESLRKITTASAQCLILSLNRDGPPGIREQTMRDDFADAFEIDWLLAGGLAGREGENQRSSWSLMLKSKK